MVTCYESIERQRCESCRDCAACCRDVPVRGAGRLLRALLLAAAFGIGGSLLAVAAVSDASAAPSAAALPQDSVYHVDAALTDQSGRAFAFADGRGEVRLASMFYATCPYVCPLLVDQVKSIEKALTPAERARLKVLLITLEAEKDTPEVLADVARRRSIDTSRWTLARPEPADLRKLSAVLDVQYRKLPDGEFNHSSVITLLDRDGRVLAQTERLGAAPEEAFIAALRQALAD